MASDRNVVSPINGTLSRWHMRVGQMVEAGDLLCEIKGPAPQDRWFLDTAPKRITAVTAGVLREIHVAEGEPVRLHAVLAVVDAATPTGIFICYRRGDSEGEAGRLYDNLVSRYGKGAVFLDVQDIPGGTDFVEHVSARIALARAVIVVIGRNWLHAKGADDTRRLDDDTDYVRSEIRAALTQDIPVLPVLIQNAQMPAARDLPQDIQVLARRNGLELRHSEWHAGVNRLQKELDKITARRRAPSQELRAPSSSRRHEP